MQQFDGITAVSELERTWIQRQAPTTPVALVPNGVDCEYFCPDDAVSANPSILFTGMMNHPPKVDAAEWFSHEIFPRLRRELPDLCFTIVGSRPHARVMALGQRPGVHITGEVEDVRPYIAGCSAFVVPLRSGGGTRLKILQAMAMERPVISTSLGAEGLEVTPGVNILIAENPAEFVKHILGLAASPEAACQLGKAGRRLVEAQYDWPICLQGLESLYDTLLGNPPMRQASVLPELEGA
jgi:glycosyltransferase involved in cell wall biosynthesis